ACSQTPPCCIGMASALAAEQAAALRSLTDCTRTYLTACCSLLASLPPLAATGAVADGRSQLAARLSEALAQLPQCPGSNPSHSSDAQANLAGNGFVEAGDSVANGNGDASLTAHGAAESWQVCWRLLQAAAAAASAMAASATAEEKACQTDEPPELPLIEEPDAEIELGVNFLTDAELDLALDLAATCRSARPDADCPPLLPPPLPPPQSLLPPSVALQTSSSSGVDKQIEDIQNTIAQQLRLQQQQAAPGRRSSAGPVRSRSPAIGACVGSDGANRVAWSADDAVTAAAAAPAATLAGSTAGAAPELEPMMRLSVAYPQHPQQQQRQLLPPFPQAGAGGGSFHPSGSSCPSLPRHCGSPGLQPPQLHQFRPASPQPQAQPPPQLPYFSLSRPRPLFAVPPPAVSASADAAGVAQFGKAQSADRL
ncbi:hypothetical protein BOX15_Mlig000946g3, partial [Macrostomum lignano]